jgi:hypothetical protein
MESEGILDRAAIDARGSNLGVLLHPVPERTMTAFFAGPIFLVRELHLPSPVVHVWLQANRIKISKAGRTVMKQFPPQSCNRTMHLTLIECITKAWTTIYIRSGVNPSPVAVAWRSANHDDHGAWGVIDLPNARSVVSARIASAGVCSMLTMLTVA